MKLKWSIVSLLILFIACAFAFNEGFFNIKHLAPTENFTKNKDSIVLIGVYDKNNQFSSLGSGIVITPSGLILTNYHVIEGMNGGIVKFNTGAIYLIKRVVGMDPFDDLATLEIEAKDLKTVSIGDSDSIKIGETVIAIGNPQGLEQSFSSGSVSAIRGEKYKKVIQTSVPISSGSSGGGLFNEEGELIGVTTATLKDSQNINFAIPINTSKFLLIYEKFIANKINVFSEDEIKKYLNSEKEIIGDLALVIKTRDEDVNPLSHEVVFEKKNNYRKYLALLEKHEDFLKVKFVYLYRVLGFNKTLERAIEQYKPLQGQFDYLPIDEESMQEAQRISSYLSTPYYYSITKCVYSRYDSNFIHKKYSLLQIVDVGKNRDLCIQISQDYGTVQNGDNISCSFLTENKPDSSCISSRDDENITKNLIELFSNEKSQSVYLSVLNNQDHPLRILFYDDPEPRKACDDFKNLFSSKYGKRLCV